MKKIISFSLWGNNLRYCGGAIVNAQLAQIHYPDWECWFYYDASVPKIYINSLNNFKNVRTILVDDGTFGAFWRFRAMQKDTIVISRDTDSRLSEREKRIVDEWLATDKKLSVIRDHTAHYDFPILAGMWGFRGGLSNEDIISMASYNMDNYYTVDQVFLHRVIWPEYNNNMHVVGLKETPWLAETYQSIGRHFVGQAYDEADRSLYNPEQF
jgi:hypothetical protein